VRQRLFFFESHRKGGKTALALSKERKTQLISQYQQWLESSQAQVLLSYKGLTMKDIDTLRSKLREIGGEFHIVKNTLTQLAIEKAGLPLPEGYFDETTAMAIAAEDAPAIAKVLLEFAKSSEFLKVKGGYLDKKPMSAEGVKALAELPPLPVMRAQLLGVFLAPASKLVRTLAEPARGLAAVIKAHAEPATSIAS
jgi:large subunit ribosomal protein L10